jgi:hypothetical protein
MGVTPPKAFASGIIRNDEILLRKKCSCCTYIRKSAEAPACYQVIDAEAHVVSR